MTGLITATHLIQWANTRISQGQLPLLVRQLILGTVDRVDVHRIGIPAEDSVFRPGVDGLLQVIHGNAFVPDGQSIWEMGTTREFKDKANDDYKKRTSAPGEIKPDETTFVFATPRRWLDKEDWASTKIAEGVWSDVRVVDADDLELWLETCPPVAAWACRVIHKLPQGICDLQEVWDQWRLRTTPELVPQLMLAGRSEATARVGAWLDNPASCLRVRANTADEAVGFLAAVIQVEDERTRARLRSRTVFVSTPDVWRAVAGQQTPVVIVAATSELGSDTQAVLRGHHVYLAYGNDSAGVPVDLDLPNARREEAENALRAMGVPEQRARYLASEGRGRVTVIVDLLEGCRTRPHWAAPTVAHELVPFLLAGAWCRSPGDTEALSQLCRADADTIERRTTQWMNEPDPPIRLVGGNWEWVSRRRAWPYLSRFINTADMAALREVVTTVLGDIDPQIDLPADQRWMASVHNCYPRYSDLLREGLASGLALMASQPNGVPGTDVPTFVSGIVRSLFGDAPDPRRWYSLAKILPTLAEAAPDAVIVDPIV